MRNKNTGAAGIIYKKSYVISDLNIISFLIRYILVAASSFLIIYIGFNSFNIDIEMKAMLKIDAVLAFILMLADINIFTAVAVNGGLLYLLYKYIKTNSDVLKSGIMSVMNEAYGVIRIAFSLPEVDGFDKVMQNTSFTVNMLAGVVTVAVVMVIALVVGRYMSKILYGIIVILLLGLTAFGGGTVGIRSAAAVVTSLITVCILNMCSGGKLTFGNKLKHKKNIYSRRGDSMYTAQLCFIACIIGIAAGSVKGIQNISKDYSGSLKAAVRDIAVMKYVEYKKFSNQDSFDAGQVGYQAYFKPNMKKKKTVQLSPADGESTLLKEFTGQNYVYRMNMWTSSDTEDADLYLNINEKNKEIIDNICKEQNFSESNDIAKAVSDYLINNYTYSIDTEPLPYGCDFINSFLTEEKKGNATHFASAAVLIFRDLGIPARYVSGYKVDNEQILTSKYNRKSGQFDVDITNANAYAWAEIYDSEKGWTAVNVSEPPSLEEMKELIDNDEEEKENPSTDIDNYFRTVDKEKYSPKNIGHSIIKTAVRILVILTLLALLLTLFILLCVILKKAIIYAKADNSEKALILIESFNKKAGISTNSLKELAIILKERGNSSEKVDNMIKLAEKIIFSKKSYSNDVKNLYRILKSLK